MLSASSSNCLKHCPPAHIHGFRINSAIDNELGMAAMLIIKTYHVSIPFPVLKAGLLLAPLDSLFAGRFIPGRFMALNSEHSCANILYNKTPCNQNLKPLSFPEAPYIYIYIYYDMCRCRSSSRNSIEFLGRPPRRVVDLDLESPDLLPCSSRRRDAPARGGAWTRLLEME